MAGLPSVPLEREQGAVQEQEAIQAGAPPAIEPTPAQADEAMLQNVSSNANVSDIGNAPIQETPAPAQPAYTVKNPYMLMPSGVNYSKKNQEKTPTEVSYDAGLLFQVMGRSNPVFKAISDELMKTRNR